jgi:hypothetical protein
MRTGSPQLPATPRWVQRVVGGLLALFVIELLARNVGAPVDLLAWWPFGTAFEPWQPLTRFLVQGGDPGTVINVCFGLFVLWLLLGQMNQRTVAWAAASAAVGATVLAGLLDLVGVLAPRPTMGWIALIPGLFALFGLLHPDGRVLLYFVLPVSGRAIVWGTLGVAALVFLAQRSLGSAEAIGSWVGVFAWWNLLGPGKRRAPRARPKERHPHLRVVNPDEDRWVNSVRVT